MAKRMTLVFDDDALYTALKVEAARQGCFAKEIVAAALVAWLDAREDEQSRAGLDEARAEWARDGGVVARTFFGRRRPGAKRS